MSWALLSLRKKCSHLIEEEKKRTVATNESYIELQIIEEIEKKMFGFKRSFKNRLLAGSGNNKHSDFFFSVFFIFCIVLFFFLLSMNE